MAKMWAGRTDGNMDKLADDFNSSIHFDCRMYRQDITGSMAHAAMLAAQGIIDKCDADALIDGLSQILQDIDMVGQNLATGQGVCGSSSGSVPTDVGQPLIRVSKITVGGR